MSGALTYPSGSLTPAERVDCRRFTGYEAFGGAGANTAGFQSWRFFTAYGELEFRLTNLAPEEFQQTRLYLAQLYPLELAILSASSNLDTDQAAVWHHNKQEVRDRTQLYGQWRRAFCGFLGVPPGPSLTLSTIRRVI